MVESAGPVPSTLEAIRERLDPAFSYVIFEKSSGAGDDSQFRQVAEILRRLKLCVHSMELLRDESEEKLLLVVRFDPGRADDIIQEFMKEGLPGDVILYAYGSREADRGRT